MKTTIEQRKRLDYLGNNRLVDILPHGSGIDAEWQIEQLRNGNVVANCSYHGMDEHGYYDGWQDFKIVIHPIPIADKCPQCDGKGFRLLHDIAKIRGVDVTSIDRDSLHVEWIGQYAFRCNACRSDYNPQILDFRLNSVGGLVRRSWAFGLRDYLVDTIHYALSDYLYQTIKVTQ
jgi:hypothetical protein